MENVSQIHMDSGKIYTIEDISDTMDLRFLLSESEKY